MWLRTNFLYQLKKEVYNNGHEVRLMTKNKDDFEAKITDLLLDETVSDKERLLLKDAQNSLVRGQADTQVAASLKSKFGLLAANRKLSAKPLELLLWITKEYKGFGTPGMGLSQLFTR